MKTASPAPRTAEERGGLWVSILLWILVCVVPAEYLCQAFTATVEQERHTQRVAVKKNLRAEMTCFQGDLKVEDILQKSLFPVQITGPKDGDVASRSSLLGGTPFPASRKEFRALVAKIRRATGARPFYALTAGSASRRWQVFLHPEAARGITLQEVGRGVEAVLAPLEKGRSEDEKALEAFFRRTFGIISPPSHPRAEVKTLYSRLWHERLFQVFLRFAQPGSNVPAGFLIFGFRESDLSPRAILRRGAQTAVNPGYRRSFGLSRPRGAYFQDTTRHRNGGGKAREGFALYAPVPGRLQYRSAVAGTDAAGGREKEKRAWMLRVRAPAALLEPSSAGWLPVVTGVCRGFILLTGFLLWMGISSPRAFLRRLRSRIALIILIGVSLPAIGLGWLASSYLEAGRRLSAEETLDFMHAELEIADHRLRRQNQRFMMDAERVRREMQRWFAARRSSPPDSGEIGGYLQAVVKSSPLKSIYLADDRGDEHAYTEGSTREFLRIFFLLFRGVFLDCLSKRGTFAAAGLSGPELERIQMTMSVCFSIVERNLEPEFHNEFFMYPGRPRENPLSLIWERLTLFFLGNDGAPPLAVGIFHSTAGTFLKGFYRHIRRHPELLLRQRQGFQIATLYYKVGSAEASYLEGDGLPRTSLPVLAEVRQRMRPLAEGISRARGSVRLNDLEGPVPRLVAARRLGSGEILAVSEAVPLKADESPWRTGIAVALFAYGLLLAGVLGSLAAFNLTRPFPALLEALRMTAMGNFDWELALERNDELGELGTAFSRMAGGLREAERMRRYVSDDVLEAVSADDENRLKPGGERVKATILFSDIRDFTTLSEAHSPELIVAMLNRYFSAMEREIRAEGGVLDKFIGDAVQAIFREKPEGNSAALRAARAALGMRRALEVFNDERNANGEFPIRTGIGLASGTVVSGRIGSTQGRLDFTVIGAPVLRAAKLEAASKHARGSGIVLDAETIERLGTQARIEELRLSREAGDEDSLPGIGELIGL